DDQYGKLRLLVPQRAEECQAAVVGELQIQQDGVETPLRRCLQRLARRAHIGRQLGDEPGILQCATHQSGDREVVLNYEQVLVGTGRGEWHGSMEEGANVAGTADRGGRQRQYNRRSVMTMT